MNRRSDGPCCGVALLKYSLFIYTTLIYLLCSVCVLCFCIYLYAAQWDYVWALASRVYPALVIILALAGFAGLVVALLACVGSLAESRRFLLCFIIPVAVVFILQVGCGIVALVYSSNVRQMTVSSLGPMIQEKYGVDGDFTASVDRLQSQERCCGAANYLQEYQSNAGNWRQAVGKRDQLEQVPESCCRSRTPLCGRRTHPSNIFTFPCAETLGDQMSSITLLVSLVCFAAAMLQLVAMVLACWLYARISHREQNKGRNAHQYYYDS